MKYSREERLVIGRRIYEGELNRFEAAEEYGICEYTARDYMRAYRDMNGLPPRNGNGAVPAVTGTEEYERMSKEELILALVKARRRIAQLEKRCEPDAGAVSE